MPRFVSSSLRRIYELVVSPLKQTLALASFEHCTQVVEIEKEKARMQKEQDAKAVADAAAAKSRAGNDIHGSL
jgi:hypothetical protein